MASASFDKAMRQFEAEEFEAAEASFRAALEHGDARVSRCHCGLGLCIACRAEPTTADFEAALECFDRAVATDRNNAHAWHNRAYALDHLGRGDEAESSRSFAAAIASPFAEAIRLFDVEEWAEARNFFERALAQHDGDASRCHNGIGLCTACLAEGEQVRLNSILIQF